jgi:hypothetical protein
LFPANLLIWRGFIGYFDTTIAGRLVVFSEEIQEKAATTGMTSVDENTMASFLLDSTTSGGPGEIAFSLPLYGHGVERSLKMGIWLH